MKLDRGSASPADAAPALDRIDRAILRQLQQDASISNVSLAAKVKLSAGCLRRVERLKDMGLIRGIVALLDPKPLGAGMLVVIGFVLDRSTPEAFAAFEKAAQQVSGCVECHVVTGEFDYFMLVRTRDNDSFNRLHAEQLLYLPGCGRCARSWCSRRFFRRMRCRCKYACSASARRTGAWHARQPGHLPTKRRQSPDTAERDRTTRAPARRTFTTRRETIAYARPVGGAGATAADSFV